MYLNETGFLLTYFTFCVILPFISLIQVFAHFVISLFFLQIHEQVYILMLEYSATLVNFPLLVDIVIDILFRILFRYKAPNASFFSNFYFIPLVSE